VGQVSVTVNGRTYDVACDDGQEEHLVELSRYLDRRVGDLIASVGQVGEARLLLMTSLLLADELSEAYAEADALRIGAGQASLPNEMDRAVGDRIDALAQQIEAVAARFREV
jgi:cell division protein ZapA